MGLFFAAGGLSAKKQPATIYAKNRDAEVPFRCSYSRWKPCGGEIRGGSYACFFSLTVAADAYYMVSVVVPTANLERCEPVVAEIQDATKLP